MDPNTESPTLALGLLEGPAYQRPRSHSDRSRLRCRSRYRPSWSCKTSTGLPGNCPAPIFEDSHGPWRSTRAGFPQEESGENDYPHEHLRQHGQRRPCYRQIQTAKPDCSRRSWHRGFGLNQRDVSERNKTFLKIGALCLVSCSTDAARSKR